MISRAIPVSGHSGIGEGLVVSRTGKHCEGPLDKHFAA